MFKCNLLILLLLIQLNNKGFGQIFDKKSNVQIDDTIKFSFIYKLTYKFDSSNLNRIYDEEFKLLIMKNSSLFISQNKFISDSMKDEAKKNTRNVDDIFRTYIVDNNKASLFPFFYKKEKTCLEFFQLMHHYCTEDKIDINWNLLNEFKIVNNKTYNKASCNFRGRNYIAWYNSEIPINVGPLKFDGLPGLIEEISEENDVIKLVLVGYEENKNNNLYSSSFEYIKTTNSEFKKLKNVFVNDPESFMKIQLSGLKIENFSLSGDFRIKNKTTILTPTNPIELVE